MNENNLIFFNKFPSKYLGAEELVSALQSLESALVLIAHGRYPNVVPLMIECIEKMLRHIQGVGPKDGVALFDLLKDYNGKHKINTDLASNIEDVRRFRNNLIHNSYSPKHDEKCIKLAFLTCMPYIDHLVRTITRNDLDGIFSSMSSVSNDWLGEVFRNTRQVIQKKANRSKKAREVKGKDSAYQIESSLVILKMVFLRIAMTGYNLKAITPAYNSLEVDFLNECETQDRGNLSEYKTSRFSIFLNQEFDGAGILLDGFDCPRCSMPRIVALEEDGEMTKVGCAGCEYTITDADVIAVFYTKKLDDSNREKLFASPYATIAIEELY